MEGGRGGEVEGGVGKWGSGGDGRVERAECRGWGRGDYVRREGGGEEKEGRVFDTGRKGREGIDKRGEREELWTRDKRE